MGTCGKQLCEVTEVVHEQLFSFWFAIGALDTTIIRRLRAAGTETHLSLSHGGFRTDTPVGKMAFKGMGAGWPQLLAKIPTV